jgi:hypothetical protein
MVLQVQRMQVQASQGQLVHFMGGSSFVVGKDAGGGGTLHLCTKTEAIPFGNLGRCAQKQGFSQG